MPNGVITLSSPTCYVPAGVAFVHVLRRVMTGWHTVRELTRYRPETLAQCPPLRLPVKLSAADGVVFTVYILLCRCVVHVPG